MPITEVRPCDWPQCTCEGHYRAPRSREEMSAFWWFCLEHVRQYNASWNYYQGMTEAEVEADVRLDTVWRRPSWRMGPNGRPYAYASMKIGDGFAFFDDEPEPRRRADNQRMTLEERALMVLDLKPPVTVAVVKARYKVLVKRHHPDANGGDKASEERFKQISEAYRTVMNSLSS